MLNWIKRLFGRGEPRPYSPHITPGDLSGSSETLAFRALIADLLRDRRAERRSRLVKAFMYLLIFGVPAFIYITFFAWQSGMRPGPGRDAVGVVSISGEISDGSMASANKVIPALRKAFESERVKAVVLSIDSPGGAPLEAERIYTAIEAWRKSHPKPVVAVINNLGASAAYMVAIHSDAIYAGRYSLVGSIGAVLSGWDFHKALERVDVKQRVYASGDLKAMLNPYVPMTPEAEAKAHDLVDKMGRQFVSEVMVAREGKLASGVSYDSGEIWGGVEAQKIGLIDEVGTLDQVIRQRWPDLQIHNFGPNSQGAFSMLGGMIPDAVKVGLREVLGMPAPGHAALR